MGVIITCKMPGWLEVGLQKSAAWLKGSAQKVSAFTLTAHYVIKRLLSSISNGCAITASQQLIQLTIYAATVAGAL